jgi:hypothetical protein
MFRQFLKSVILGFAIFIIMGTLSPASAQFTRDGRADASIDSAQDMLAWMQESGAVVQELMPLMGDDLLGALLAPISGEVIDLEGLGLAVDAYEEARVEILARSQARIDALPAPEKWNFDRSLFSSLERGIYKATQQQYSDLQDTQDAFASISNDMLIGFRKLSNEEEIDLQAILGRISETSIRVLLSENRVLEAFTAAMPSASPNKNFHQIMLTLNNSTLVEMEMLAEYEMYVDPISIRQDYGRRMQAALSDIPNLIRTGRRKIETQNESYRNNLTNSRLTDKERKLLNDVIPATLTFGQSFDIEQQLYDNDLKTAKLYMSDRTDEDIEAETDAITAQLSSLLEQRMSIMMGRMASLQ